MTVETLPIADILPDPSNIRRHPESQISMLAASLKRWGQTLPLLIDRDNVVRVGNARLTAMQRLGWESAKVVRLDLSPTEWVALSVADNALHDQSQFDRQGLADVLTALRAEDTTLMDAVGFSPEDLSELLGGGSPGGEPPAPDAFPSYGEDIQTEHECPRCHFKWSGSSAPKGAT